MKKNRRLSDQPRRKSSYPDSVASHATRASSIFPYSTARPPTDYSTQSWLPRASNPPPLPSGPVSHQSTNEDPFADETSSEQEESLEGRETPLYARSDWDATTEGGRTPAKTPRLPGDGDRDDLETAASAWSRSSFAGMTTGVSMTSRRPSTLGDIQEEGEEESSIGSEQTGWYGPEVVDSPGAMTATPRTAQSPYSVYPQTFANSRVQSSLPRRSSLPSVLELQDLVPRAKPYGKPDRPFSEGVVQYGEGYNPQTTPGALGMPHAYGLYSPAQAQELLPKGMEIMTPEAQQRLGRMSVAPAPNHLYAEEHDEKYFDNQSPGEPRNLTRGVKRAVVSRKSGIVRTFVPYRPFTSAALAITAALLVSMSLQNVQGKVSRYVVLKEGAFPVYPKNVGDVGLGLTGWCQIEGDRCEAYGNGEFASSTYRVSRNETLYSLGDMMSALCAFAWLQALYLISTSFLHDYLYTSLSLPYSYILDAEEEMVESGFVIDGQAEVDIRIRCERPPWEGLAWVWWAWWAHRRSPLGPLFGIVNFVLSMSSLVLAFMFKKSVANAAGENVTLAAGAYIPLIALLLTADPTISGLKWFFKAASSWRTFLSPPPPSPAAILLPPESKPMTHVRPTTGASFFAPRRTPRQTFASRLQTGVTGFGEDIPPVPGAELDEETRRWLMAYPTDSELVPLIADLRGGKPNDDFILSDVGLLYLRPSEEEEAAGAEALLVPPRGVIRRQILEDTHNVIEEDGRSAHHGVGAMLDILSQTFWWHGMEEDARGFVKGCAGCAFERGQGVGGIDGMKDGMTPVPFTGVTGWTGALTSAGPGDSAMAAEMAFAMRKAEQEADRDGLR